MLEIQTKHQDYIKIYLIRKQSSQKYLMTILFEQITFMLKVHSQV